MLRKIGFLLVSLFLLFAGVEMVYDGWKNREPTRTTVADYVNSDKSKKWVVLTDAKINLLNAVTVTRKKDGEPSELSELYIPIESAKSTKNDTVNLLLETHDEEILNVARQLMAKSEADLLQFIVREKDKLIRSVELSGVMTKGEENKIGNEIRKHIKNLDNEFYILDHNSLFRSFKYGLTMMGIALFLLTSFILSPFREREAKEEAKEKAAVARVKMKAITEAYEESKRETHAAYDYRGQVAKSPRPRSPSIIVPPKMDDVVVEQKSVPLPDRDKSQVSPHRPPPDYYKILGISHAADLQKIKQAAQTKANEIKTAFTVLSHAETRTAYNANLSYAETRIAYDAKLNQWPHNHYGTLAVSREADLDKIKAAAQARMSEIKEAYETLSKPETRTAYDSQWQVAKAPMPRPAPIPHFPKMEKVVVEQKPVSPPDKDKSQVSPYQPPTVSPTDAARYTKELELAERAKHTVGPNHARRKDRNTIEIKLAKPGTCLIALIVDAFTLVVPIIFWSLFNSFPFQRLVSGERADICVIVTKLIFIGVIMTNLVLFYHYGQTLGRRLLAIKIVDANGRRAGLCEFWVVKLLIIMLYFIIGVMMLILPNVLLTAIGRMPLVWYLGLISIGVVMLIWSFRLIIMLISDIIRNPRCSHHTLAHTTKVSVFPTSYESPTYVRWILANPPSPCSHNTLAHAIEVRVVPGKNDIPYGSLAGVIGTSTLMAVMFGLAAWGMINAHTDYVERSKVSLERSKVSEVIEFLNVQKGSAAESIAATGEFPLMGSILRLTSKTSGKYLASVVSNSKEFYFEATMSKEEDVLAGKTVRLIYHPKSKIWTCSAAYPNGIPEKYLPNACK